MANSFYLQILSVNRQFFSGRCEALIFQEEDGEREIQAYHENMIIAVHEGEIRFRPEGSEEWLYGVVGVGFVQIANNRVTLLVETAENPDEIDIPAPVVDMIYVRKGEKKPFCPMWQRAVAKAKAKAAEGGK